MARIGVTLEDVSEAASKLILNGKKPTVALVREFLGTGSNTTIAKHLKCWRNNQSINSKFSLPDKIPDSLAPLFETFWVSAMDEAEKKYSDKEDEWHKKKDALQSMLADFEEQLNQALDSSDHLQKKLRVKKREYDDLLQEHIHLKTEFRKFRSRL